MASTAHRMALDRHPQAASTRAEVDAVQDRDPDDHDVSGLYTQPHTAPHVSGLYDSRTWSAGDQPLQHHFPSSNGAHQAWPISMSDADSSQDLLWALTSNVSNLDPLANYLTFSPVPVVPTMIGESEPLSDYAFTHGSSNTTLDQTAREEHSSLTATTTNQAAIARTTPSGTAALSTIAGEFLLDPAYLAPRGDLYHLPSNTSAAATLATPHTRPAQQQQWDTLTYPTTDMSGVTTQYSHFGDFIPFNDHYATELLGDHSQLTATQPLFDTFANTTFHSGSILGTTLDHVVDTTGQLPGVVTGQPDSAPRVDGQGSLDPELQPGETLTSDSAQPPRKKQRGGRVPGFRLSEARRQQTTERRREGACWPCKQSRVACTGGDPCDRCATRAKNCVRHLPNAIPPNLCIRSRLQDRIGLVLTSSLTDPNTKSRLTEFMQDRIGRWFRRDQPGINVHLNIGSMGPRIDWVYLHEFEPAPGYQSLRGQMQYNSNAQRTSYIVPSPCLAFTHLSDEVYSRFDKWIDQVVDGHLYKFGDKFFGEGDQFQRDAVLRACTLYRSLNTEDEDQKALKDSLRTVLRLWIITFTMGSVICIREDQKAHVLSQLQHPGNLDEYRRFTSSRVASYQLKCYFSHLREKAYYQLLKELNHILGNSKDRSWVRAFCLMLGLGVAIEEAQHLVHMLKDKSAKSHGGDPKEYMEPAMEECRAMDSMYKLLIHLFHNKFAKKHRKYAHVADLMAILPPDCPQLTFIRNLQQLVSTRAESLRERGRTPLAQDTYSRWTSRLVAHLFDQFFDFDLY